MNFSLSASIFVAKFEDAAEDCSARQELRKEFAAMQAMP
jgi:hypothetical protein